MQYNVKENQKKTSHSQSRAQTSSSGILEGRSTGVSPMSVTALGLLGSRVVALSQVDELQMSMCKGYLATHNVHLVGHLWEESK